MDADTSLDLSKATGLSDLVFRCAVPNVRSAVTALRTVKSKNLQQITIRLYPANLRDWTEGEDHPELQDLDRTLVQFWILHSICPRFLYGLEGEEMDTMAHVSLLFPELTRRGLVDVVEPTFPFRGGRMRRRSLGWVWPFFPYSPMPFVSACG